MRISGKPGSIGGSQGISGPKTSSTPGLAPVTPASASDAVQVSSTARLMAVAHEALAAVPDIRLEKVEAIKNQLDADTYNPDGEAVAEGLIKEHMAEGPRS
jgi:negative regulator of flagellin synthesis FlgM